MIGFDIEGFVRRRMTGRSESLLAEDFARFGGELRSRLDGRRVLVVGGAGTIGSSYVKAALRWARPAAMHVVDIDENSLTELTRDLRAGEGAVVPDEYVTEPLDLGSRLFEKYFRVRGPFDVVANFAARKHVRAERDVHSIEAMCETNVFMAKKLLDLLVERPPERFFCVSTQRSVLNIQQSLSPHLQLLGALLTTNIQHALVFQVEYRLQSERALAYTRLTSQQHYASLNESSAKHAVEFFVVHVYSWNVLR